MSLYKRGNIWWCKWDFGGATTRETTRTANREEAQEYHDTRRAALWRESSLDQKQAPTWDQACLAWCEEHACQKKSYADDKSRLRWINPELKGRRLDKIDNTLLIALRTKCSKDGRGPSTCNKHLAIVSAVLNYAKDKGQIPGVPTIPYFKEPEGRLRYLKREEADKLIAELPKHLKQITRFGLATGMRRSNITGLTWDNVDLARRAAWIWPDEAKSSKAISVPLNDDAVAVLQEQLGEHPVFVFTFRDAPIWHVKTKAWDNACERAELADVGFHTIRHTWASWHVMAGTPLNVLMQLGGWASMDMVMRYAHLNPGYIAEYAGNVVRDHAAPVHNSGTVLNCEAEETSQHADSMGWLMGLEPTTTGITSLKRRTGTK